jgi:hypothetical protein
MISTGPDDAVATSRMSRTVTVDPSVLDDGVLTFRFVYNYVSEEYPEFVGTEFNDSFDATIVLPSGATIPVAAESVNSTIFTPVTGIDFPGGDRTVGQSGWRTATVNLSAGQVGGHDAVDFVVSDRGDFIVDSVVFLDAFSVG